MLISNIDDSILDDLEKGEYVRVGTYIASAEHVELMID